MGYGVGVRLLEVLCYRERSMRRETRLLDMLKFVHSTLWKYLFGRQVGGSAGGACGTRVQATPPSVCQAQQGRYPKAHAPRAPPSRCRVQARDLEQSNSAEDEYMISDFDLFVTKFISVPREMGHLNCAAFVAGVVRGTLDAAGFPAR